MLNISNCFPVTSMTSPEKPQEIVMSNLPLNLGFVGGAPDSAVGYAHYCASRMDNLWSLKAGAFSTHAEANKKAGETYGVAEDRTYGSLGEMLEKEGDALDAVVILTPTPLHHEMILQCLNAGMRVICEKAMALTSGEAEELRQACEASQGYLAVIYNYSGYPMVRELRRMIDQGELGEILHFQAEMPQEGYLRTDADGNKPCPQQWRLKDGPMPILHLDLAVHLHELIHYLTGLTPLEVVADQASRGWFDVVDNVNCLCRYTEKVQGQMWFSKCALGHRNGLRLRLYGSKASAEWFQANPEELEVAYADGRRVKLDRASSVSVASEQRYTRFKAGHPAGFIEAFANLYRDLADSVHDHKQGGSGASREVFGADLSIEGLKFLEALVRSSKSSNWEKVQ